MGGKDDECERLKEVYPYGVEVSEYSEIKNIEAGFGVLECHFGDILVLPIRALCERYIEWREVPITSGKRSFVSAVIAVI